MPSKFGIMDRAGSLNQPTTTKSTNFKSALLSILKSKAPQQMKPTKPKTPYENFQDAKAKLNKIKRQFIECQEKVMDYSQFLKMGRYFLQSGKISLRKMCKQKQLKDNYITKSWYVQQEILKLGSNIQKLSNEVKEKTNKMEQIKKVLPKQKEMMEKLREQKNNQITEVCRLMELVPDEEFTDSWFYKQKDIQVFNWMSQMYLRQIKESQQTDKKQSKQKPKSNQEQETTFVKSTPEQITQEVERLSPYSTVDKKILEKKIRGLKKKLRQITQLEEKQGITLTKEQQIKIDKKQSILKELKEMQQYL